MPPEAPNDMRTNAVEAPPPAVDRFEVKICRVRGELRTAEARPVFLTFDFDEGFWTRETSVYGDDVNPEWQFAPKTAGAANMPETRFVYRTEFAHRMHKKHLSVTLSERSPHGDVVWGSGTVSLDSLALGCENVALNMIAPDDVTCYGTVRFRLSMLNVAEVTAHLSDLVLKDYPERFAHDVKLVYFEFGLTGFEKGYRHCTERRSDTEPRFYSRPALTRDCRLREMVSPSPAAHGPMRVFFSVHRQVARNRTEQIGLGALPVRMLFQKVSNGYMEVPTKFMVPLQKKQGVLKGKILLRNIPRFHQLPGDDLVNVNGVVTPIDEDLSQRKIVPWMKLPRPLVSQAKRPPPPVPPPAFHEDTAGKHISDVSAASPDATPDMSGRIAPVVPEPVAQPTRNALPLQIQAPSEPAQTLFAKGHPPELIRVGSDPASPASQGVELSCEGLSNLHLYSYTQRAGVSAHSPRSERSKSAASYSTVDGGVEVGSVLNSITSEDDSEWVAVEDPSNGLFYFASKITNESLWLPPDWQRETDTEGRQLFVDHSSGVRQYAFPANEARRYRESVYSRQ